MIREYTVCGCPVLRHYTICHDGNNMVGLLFESTDIEAVGSIADLTKIFPKGFSIRLVGLKNPSRYVQGEGWTVRDINPSEATSIVVSPRDLRDEPDKVAFDARPLIFYFNGKRYNIKLRERYNRCLSLFKAVGCGSCPDRGLKCLGEDAGFVVPDRFDEKLDDDALLELLPKHHQKMGDFEYTSPATTRVKNEFASTFRQYWEHDFSLIAPNAEELSTRAERAAESRRFKREQCSKCPIKNSCEAFRHCKGAFPPLEDIIKQSNEELRVALSKSAWPEWQLWAVARGMGNSAKHSRWNIFLAGLKMQGSDGIVASVKRAKLDITEYGGLKTYADIAEAFTLPTSEELVDDNRYGPPIDLGLRAAFWLALNTPHAHHRYGWGCEEHVAGLGLTHSKVTVRWTNGKYLRSWSDLISVADVARHLSYGRLAHIQKIEVRDGWRENA